MRIDYLKTAWHHLSRNKVNAAINIGGLAIGIATCLLLLLYVAYQWDLQRFL